MKSGDCDFNGDIPNSPCESHHLQHRNNKTPSIKTCQAELMSNMLAYTALSIALSTSLANMFGYDFLFPRSLKLNTMASCCIPSSSMFRYVYMYWALDLIHHHRAQLKTTASFIKSEARCTSIYTSILDLILLRATLYVTQAPSSLFRSLLSFLYHLQSSKEPSLGECLLPRGKTRIDQVLARA